MKLYKVATKFPLITDIRQARVLFIRLWVYPKWSNNILRPKFGVPNFYKNARERLHFIWLSKEEHNELIEYLGTF